VRQDGRSASLTAPNGQAQRDLLLSAHTAGGPQLSHIEAHGTGTQLGDPVEIRALAASILGHRLHGELSPVGSAKANGGHAEPAAGMVGLVALRMSLRGGEAAPNAHLRCTNQHVLAAVQGRACVLPTQLSPLPCSESLSVGGVSSFGYSGTIAHAVLVYDSPKAGSEPDCTVTYVRRRFSWREMGHPLAQTRLHTAGGISRAHTFGAPVR